MEPIHVPDPVPEQTIERLPVERPAMIDRPHPGHAERPELLAGPARQAEPVPALVERPAPEKARLPIRPEHEARQEAVLAPDLLPTPVGRQSDLPGMVELVSREPWVLPSRLNLRDEPEHA